MHLLIIFCIIHLNLQSNSNYQTDLLVLTGKTFASEMPGSGSRKF